MKRSKIKVINNIMHYGIIAYYKRKKFVYWKKIKGISTMSAGYFYCPYIPLITKPKHKGKFS